MFRDKGQVGTFWGHVTNGEGWGHGDISRIYAGMSRVPSPEAKVTMGGTL